jgi:hypothetical protein
MPWKILIAIVLFKMCDEIPAKRQKMVKYQESFLKYEFYFTVKDNVQKPMCLSYREVYAATSFKQSNLKRHQQAAHPETVDQNLLITSKNSSQILNWNSSFVVSDWKLRTRSA